MTLSDVEQRLTALEKEIEQLKRRGSDAPPRTGRWYVQHAGRFKGDPVYAEIARRGRKYRESLRPKARRKPKR